MTTAHIFTPAIDHDATARLRRNALLVQQLDATLALGDTETMIWCAHQDQDTEAAIWRWVSGQPMALDLSIEVYPATADKDRTLLVLRNNAVIVRCYWRTPRAS